MESDIERRERIQGYRDELFQNLRRAYEQRRPAPDFSLQLLRQAAEGLCYCTLLAKNRVGVEHRGELGELVRRATPFLERDADALAALREWGNRASHARGRPERASSEVATAMFLLTAKPLQWLCREILDEEMPDDLAERYRAILLATRVAPAVAHQAVHLGAERSGGQSAALASRPRAGPVLLTGAVLAILGAGVGYLAVQRNDGTDPVRPVLRESDRGFVDARGGWGWGDRCWVSIQAKKWGWAKAECDEGMKMTPASPQPRASLLYNEGLIAREAGRFDEARTTFAESLSLREHPEVRAALNSLPLR